MNPRARTCATLLAATWMTTAGIAQTPAKPTTPAPQAEQPLFMVTVAGKAGFIDATGKLVIQPTFTKAYPFHEGLAAVQSGKLWGYINKRGEVVVEPRFAMPGSFSEGLASFRTEFTSPWGYINRAGEVVIEPQFDTAERFHNGIARVGFETRRSKVVGRIADVGIQVSHRFIDRSGTILAEPPPLHVATGESGDRIRIERNGRWGYRDAAGHTAIEPRFLTALPFSDGLAAVNHEGAFGFLDKQGEFVIEPRYPAANSFSEGLAGVRFDDNKWGFIDKSGKVVIEPQFAWVYGGFRHGLAQVAQDGALGYVDKQGEWVWRPRR